MLQTGHAFRCPDDFAVDRAASCVQHHRETDQEYAAPIHLGKFTSDLIGLFMAYL